MFYLLCVAVFFSFLATSFSVCSQDITYKVPLLGSSLKYRLTNRCYQLLLLHEKLHVKPVEFRFVPILPGIVL